MIAIKKTAAQQRLTPNLLPCAIKHDGPVPVDQRYWTPVEEGSKKIVYFRGRKLEGAGVRIPDGFEGVVLQKTEERSIERPSLLEEDQVAAPETKLFSQQASFEEIVVWGHEMVPDADDAYVKSVQEWMAFAEAMHSPEDGDTS